MPCSREQIQVEKITNISSMFRIIESLVKDMLNPEVVCLMAEKMHKSEGSVYRTTITIVLSELKPVMGLLV